MDSDEPLWVGFLPFKDDAPTIMRAGAEGFQISSADTKAGLVSARAYQELCRNTIPIVPPSELDICLAIAAVMEAEQALATLTVKESAHVQEPPVKKRRGPVPPPPPASAKAKVSKTVSTQ